MPCLLLDKMVAFATALRAAVVVVVRPVNIRCLAFYANAKDAYRITKPQSGTVGLHHEQQHPQQPQQQQQRRYKSQFRFTLEGGTKLSASQRQFYEDNGYLVVRGLFEPRELQAFSKRFEEIACGRAKVPGLTVMRDIALKDAANPDKYVVNKLQDLFLDDQLWQYCIDPRVLDWAEAFVGPNQMAVHTMLINKPPDTGGLTSRHPLHQDLHYFPFRPADRIVCSWTAIERVVRENGCLVAVPGSHKGPLLEHEYPEWKDGVNKAYHGIKKFEQASERRVHLEMEPGDTVFFHPLLIHGSGANRSKGFRKAISCHYAASECEYIDVAGTSQEIIAKEVIEIAHRRGLPISDYRDAWRFRAQLVRGQQINL